VKYPWALSGTPENFQAPIYGAHRAVILTTAQPSCLTWAALVSGYFLPLCPCNILAILSVFSDFRHTVLLSC